MDRGLIMSHYIIWIFIYTYIYIYIYIYKLISNTPWAEGRPCIFYVCVREIRMATRSLCLPFSWAEDDLWSRDFAGRWVYAFMGGRWAMHGVAMSHDFIRFAILHLFLYASLYPPASVPSPHGRLTRVTGSSLPFALTLHSAWNGCPCGGGGVYKEQKFGF